MKKFLIVHHKPEMRDMLHSALLESFDDDGEHPLVTHVNNQKEALRHCGMGERFDCIVLSLDMPADWGQPTNPRQGHKLLRALRTRSIETPCLVLGPAWDAGIEDDLLELKATPVFEDRIKDTLDQVVVQFARQVFGQKEKPEHNRLEVEINLSHEKLKTFVVKDLLGLIPSARGELKLGEEPLSSRMEQLIDTLRTHEPSRANRLRELGRNLQHEFLEHKPNLKLRDAIVGAQRVTGCSKEEIQLRFVVSEEEHVVPLEAIMTIDAEHDEYWMLQAPLYRSVRPRNATASRGKPLFMGEKKRQYPLNCLLINADTFGPVDGPTCRLEQMHNTKKECETLKEILELCKEDLFLGKIKLLSPDESSEKDTPCADTLRERLASESWHLVHYAGHSYYDSKKGRGYFFLPEKFSPAPKPVEARKFASWFREAPRFIYLSSCESAADDFVFELVDAGFPAVAGFRWGIKEDAANAYAKSFYKYLLKLRCLEVAFWKARREIHDKWQPEENLIWAAAMLVVQDYW